MKNLLSKRIFSAFLVMAMAGMAGCTTGGVTAQPSSSAGGSSAPASSAPAAQTEKPKEIVEISWYLSQDGTQPDEQKVYDELNKYTEEKIGVRVKQVIYKNADYNEKVPVMISSGQKYDICFTASWGNKFLPSVDRGAYADLTELLPQYAKETVAAVPEMVWKAATVDGKIYAVPAYKEVGAQAGLMINKDLAEKNGLDLSKVTSLETMEPVLQQVKEKLPGVIPYANSNFSILSPYEPLGGDSTLPAVAAVKGFTEYSDQGDKVFNLYETKEFEAYCNLMHKWKKAGYLPDDPVTYDTDNAGRDRDDQANKLFSWVISYAPGYKDTRAASIGHGVEYIPLRDPVYSGGGGMMAISSLSDNKEQALQFLNLVNTDPYVGTLLRHGSKDVHYKEVEKTDAAGNKVIQCDPFATGFTAETHPYNITFGWQFGNVFNQNWVTSYAPDIADQFEIYNKGAKQVTNLGFTIDLTNISTEQASLSNVVKEYLEPLTTGMVDPAVNISKFQKALKDNGVEKFTAEIQTQIDQWNTEQNKG